MSKDGWPERLVAKAAAHASEAGRLLANEREPARAVHLARRQIKRARSLLRVLKPLAKDAVIRHNKALRRYSHALAPARDAAAMAEAALTVGARVGAPIGHGTVDTRLIAHGLTQTGALIASVPTAAAEKDFLAHGITRSYRKARRAFRAFLDDPHGEPLHDARKRLKDCLHLIDAVREARPAGIPPKRKRLEAAGELLGEIRDLDILAARLSEPEATPAKRARIAARRRRLERDARQVGAKAFRYKPGSLMRQWRQVTA